jgi:hypothetical protein
MSKRGFMKAYLWFILVIILSFLSLRLIAQEATEEAPLGWPIVERCVGEARTAPDDWSFEGTILATGWAGLHGINAEWETPRILIFQDDWYPERYGYGLSPNEEWYAVIQYDYIQQFPRSYIRTYGLKIYSTRDRGVSYFYPIEASEETQVFWLDDEHVIYSINRDNFILNPFTGESDSYSGIVNDRMLISPDSHFATNSSYRTLEWYFEDLSNHETLFIERDGYPTEISHDSELIAVHRREEIEGEDYREIGSVVLIHPNGELEDTVFVGTIPASGLYGSFSYLSYGWSRDGHYYAFVPTDDGGISRKGLLHLADTEERIVINTCLTTSNAGLAWSPSENKLVVGYSDYGQVPLQILDLELWQAYRTQQYHSGTIIGWRAD